jgi:hypothetical protein
MADFPPPPSAADGEVIFHLDEWLNYLAAAAYAGQLDRGILITNQNSQQQQLSTFDARLDATDSAISSSSAQLSQNIAALGSASASYFEAAQAAFAELNASLNAKIDTFNAGLSDLLTLLKALIQALQGVATTEKQDQEIAFLQQLVQATGFERPKTIGLDVTNVVKTPQPIPAKPGPR